MLTWFTLENQSLYFKSAIRKSNASHQNCHFANSFVPVHSSFSGVICADCWVISAALDMEDGHHYLCRHTKVSDCEVSVPGLKLNLRFKIA